MSNSAETNPGLQSSGMFAQYFQGWRSAQTLPLGRRILANLGYAIAPAAIVFALGARVSALLWFNHRETATCNVTYVSAERAGDRGGELWDVNTSCGATLINSRGGVLGPISSAKLAGSLRTDGGHNTYVLKFEGWGPGRLLIGASPAKL